MAYDATVEVMLLPRGRVDWSRDEFVTTWRVGAIVAVYTPPKIPAVIGMPRTGYVQVMDIPDSVPVEGLIEVLQKKWHGIDVKTVLENRIWTLDPNAFSTPEKKSLEGGRTVTVNWSRFKDLSRNLATEEKLTDSEFTKESDRGLRG